MSCLWRYKCRAAQSQLYRRLKKKQQMVLICYVYRHNSTKYCDKNFKSISPNPTCLQMKNNPAENLFLYSQSALREQLNLCIQPVWEIFFLEVLHFPFCVPPDSGFVDVLQSLVDLLGSLHHSAMPHKAAAHHEFTAAQRRGMSAAYKHDNV